MADNESLANLFNVDKSAQTDATLNMILRALRKHLNMEVSFISEFKEGRRVFKLVDCDSENAAIDVGDSDPLEETYCQRIVDHTLDNIIQDTHEHPTTKQLKVTETLSIGAYMGVPISLKSGEIYGTLCCFKSSQDNTLNNRDLQFLSVVSEIVADFIDQDIVTHTEDRDIRARIKSVLVDGNTTMHYQPIYHLTDNMLAGYESLARFSTEPYRTPDLWFADAEKVGFGEMLEIKAVEKALSGLAVLPESAYISINISPKYVLSGALSQALTPVDLSRIVIEITEHSPVDEYSQFESILAPLRERGMRLAIDDAGAGYSTFQHILELEPDIIKLDISLIRDVHLVKRKYLLAKAICAFAKSIDCRIIAEGVEVIEELKVLETIGVDMVQGYFIGKPMPLEAAQSFVPAL